MKQAIILGILIAILLLLYSIYTNGSVGKNITLYRNKNREQFKVSESSWDMEKLRSKSKNDQDNCHIAIFEGKCGDSPGGVYKLSKEWVTGHFGGNFLEKRDGKGTCGNLVEDWLGKGDGGHTAAALKDPGRVTRVADFKCPTTTKPPTTTTLPPTTTTTAAATAATNAADTRQALCESITRTNTTFIRRQNRCDERNEVRDKNLCNEYLCGFAPQKKKKMNAGIIENNNPCYITQVGSVMQQTAVHTLHADGLHLNKPNSKI